MRGVVDKDTGEIIVTASGQRMWVGTKQAHANAVSAGIMPNNCIVAITDDYADSETSGEGARNTSYVSADSYAAKWFKYGRICTVEIQMNLSANTTSNEELITGFPKPVTPVAVVAQGSDNSAVGSLVIKSNGAVRTHYAGTKNQFFHVTATYITAE